MKSANEFSVDVMDWLLLSPGIETREDAVSWAARGGVWPADPAPVKADAIPAIVRRRVSSLTKMGLQAALAVTGDQHVDYAAFSCRHGELARTTVLIQDILAGGDASPMAFSQSVHNTTAGLFTIVSNRPIPVTSIASGHDSFHEALIDVYAYLVEHPDHTVLLVDFDEPLPGPYDVYETMPYPGHALGLLLRAGTSWTCRGVRSDTEAHPVLPQALEFLLAHVSDRSDWTCTSPRYEWQWTRRAA